jgi:hypothetical protein
MLQANNEPVLCFKKLMDIQDVNHCDITGANLHGFKQKRSTCTSLLSIGTAIHR